MNAIEVSDLKKTYGKTVAVDGISFNVKEGSFFAFLGPNGAGKSTTISIICSLMDYDSGTVKIFGKYPLEARTDLGVVFQDHMLDQKLKVRENISLRGEMYGLKGKELNDSVDRVLKLMQADNLADRFYGDLSGGQKRRVDIARALVHNPRILILDEPTSGLDPQSRKALWKTVFDLNRKEGLTVFLTTHYMEEATDADDIVIIDGGRIVAQGTPDNLKMKYCTDYLRIIPRDADTFESLIKSKGLEYSEDKGVFTISLNSTMDSLPILDGLKTEIQSFEVRVGTLDDAFIKITGDCDDE